MTKNIKALKIKLRRKCPLCDRLLRPTSSGRWYCDNPKCPVMYVRFSRYGDILRIVYAQGGLEHE